MKKMKIEFILPYQGGPSAARFIQGAYVRAFEKKGFSAKIHEKNKLKLTTTEIPDILFCDVVATPFEDEKFVNYLRFAKANGTKILVWTYWPLVDLPIERTDALRATDLVDAFIGEREMDAMSEFVRETKHSYTTVPMFAASEHLRPGKYDQRFAYDIAFVGARLPKKKWFNEKILEKLKRKYRVGIFGANWTLTDNVKRGVSKGLRLSGLSSIAQVIDRRRISLSEEQEQSLYFSSKICLNFHEREKDLSQPHHIVNFRTFKIPAMGGFQICDDVAGLSNYFKDNEIVKLKCDQKLWLSKIDYYMENESERREITARSRNRVIADHLDTTRVEQILKILEIC